MFNKGILKIMSLLLLFAVMALAIPFQQIFHHHEDQVCYSGKGKSALSEYEKPCCKKADFFNHAQAILQEQQFTFLETAYHYKSPAYTAVLLSPVFFNTNKAPPVA
ncbi:MAG: hypothetical protein EOO20_21070 [Chryseobacterium sp.]|nr:MAG: hypothetical protein EOO20_21070 [Chryseobacterium sp.]